MASVNKVILVGNLGRDPEVRYMPNGEAVANFSIATTDNWKDKSGQRQERTEWHNIVMYRRLAEIAGEYLKKGRPVYIEGHIQSRKYTDKQGVERTAFEIVADQMQMLGGRDGATGGGGNYEPPGQQDEAPRMRDDAPAAPPQRREVAQTATAPQSFNDLDDDIPF